MLVLSRREGQKLIIGDIILTVTKLKGNTVQLGIEAPQEVKILRGELENKEESKHDTRP
jgi:carbon storage regulator